MRLGIASILSGVAVLVGAVAAAQAAPISVKVEVPALRPIQTYSLDETANDDAYLLVTGVAKGQELALRQEPKEGVWSVGPKKHPVTSKAPLTLWEGELADGEFALVTVTLMQGKGADKASVKTYLDKKAAAEKAVAERAKKTLAGDDFKKLMEGTLKGHHELVTKIKDIFSREKKTDHYGGQFTVAVWNNGGKLVKRLDPVGLTFGEHYGIDEKIYTKIKWTLTNVFVQDASGEWSKVKLGPVNEDQTALRVKALETERVKQGADIVRNVTDYVFDVRVLLKDEPQTWDLGGEVLNDKGDTHSYWEWAE